MSDSKTLLMLGLPKGSLEKATCSLFDKAGFKITMSSRSYKPVVNDPDIEARLVRAQEMSRYVEHGFFDCGSRCLLEQSSFYSFFLLNAQRALDKAFQSGLIRGIRLP